MHARVLVKENEEVEEGWSYVVSFYDSSHSLNFSLGGPIALLVVIITDFLQDQNSKL